MSRRMVRGVPQYAVYYLADGTTRFYELSDKIGQWQEWKCRRERARQASLAFE